MKDQPGEKILDVSVGTINYAMQRTQNDPLLRLLDKDDVL